MYSVVNFKQAMADNEFRTIRRVAADNFIDVWVIRRFTMKDRCKRLCNVGTRMTIANGMPTIPCYLSVTYDNCREISN